MRIIRKRFIFLGISERIMIVCHLLKDIFNRLLNDFFNRTRNKYLKIHESFFSTLRHSF